MKYLYILFFLTASISVKSQTPILPLYNSQMYGSVPNAYFKDLDHDFDNFTGTWLYTNGTTSIKVVLRKQEQVHSELSKLYTDVMYGDYQYIENGIEKINTLHQLQDNGLHPYLSSIFGNAINTADRVPACNVCDPSQKRVILTFKDPTRAMVEGLRGRIVLRRVDSNGQQKIEMWLMQAGNIIQIGDTPPQFDSLSIPWGKYVLTKVD